MPELPEVETVRRTLEKQILTKQITNVEVYYEKMLENVSKEDFINSLINEHFTSIKRYGKYLIFILDNYSIISHLRMEGKFFLKKTNSPLSKHEHIVFTLDNDISFRYHDTRKFGIMALLKTTDINEIMKYPSLAKLAKEANDPTFDQVNLYNVFKTKKMPIKGVLLDQSIIAGLGNIYVDEVCFMSKINPKTKACDLTLDDVKNIITSSQKVLEKAIEAGGTTIRSYTSSLGVTGRFQLELLVHSKENAPCPICKTKIVKEFVCGRGTYYCPVCQKKVGKKIIGITGSIASGKTTITNVLIQRMYEVIDADEIVKSLKRIGEKIYNKLVEEYGNSILDDTFNIDNTKLSKIVFENSSERERLNRIIHPIVKARIKHLINISKQDLIFISVPLLYEAGFDDLCDMVIVVKTTEDVLLDRLTKRNNIDIESAKKRLYAQMPQSIKCEKANYIIDNSKDLCYTIKQLDEILLKIGG